MNTRAIVVGTDGTDSSTAAVRWAAREAHRRRQPLRVIHAYEADWAEARYAAGSEYYDIIRSAAETVAADAVDQARAAAPQVKVVGQAIIGQPVASLLEQAERADLIVLGCRGRGGFSGLLLGSVSQRVATHASSAAVVVRGDADPPAGSVAVGVDDAPNAVHVLETAFVEAAGRDAALVVVRSHLPVLPHWPADVLAQETATQEQDEAELARLKDQLAPWRGKYPDVPVKIVLTHDSAASALVDASKHAQIVVVGSRGRGLLAGALLGSTGLQLLHHAHCPVYLDRQR